MIYFSKIQSLIIILINGIAIWLGIWVYTNNPHSKINRLYLLCSLFLLFWINFGFLSTIIDKIELVLFFLRARFGIVSLFIVSGFLFSINFPQEREYKYSFFSSLIVLLGSFLFFFSILSNFVIKNVEINLGRGFDVNFGEGKLFFFLTILFLIFLIIHILFKKYFVLPKEEKIKVQYFLIGLFIFALGNLIFNIFFPLFKNTFKYYYLGDFSTIFFLGFTAYAIVKRELFGIRVVLTEILVAFIAILLFLQIIISKSPFEIIWKSLLLFLFIFFGYSLVKSVIREIKYREQLQKAYQKLKELDKAKSEFISIASHQLRTPLTAIKGYISMLLEGSYGEFPEKAKRPVESVYKSNERLIKLVNDLLNISRIESGKIEINLKKSSIEEIIESVIEELKIEAEKKKIYLKFEKEELPKIKIDSEKIRNVILNIIDNAIRYTDKGGVTVKAYKTDDKIQIVISDTGAGMTKEELGKIFESFSRAGAGSKFYTEGAGLGLYVAKKFIELHGGKIWAVSPGIGKGSTFYIELPLGQEAQE